MKNPLNLLETLSDVLLIRPYPLLLLSVNSK